MTARTVAQQAAIKTMHQARRAATAARVEDLVFLLENGTTVHEAVKRLDWTMQGAERELHRRGLHQVARAVYARRAA